jgi:hypothetical protein
MPQTTFPTGLLTAAGAACAGVSGAGLRDTVPGHFRRVARGPLLRFIPDPDGCEVLR